MKAKYRVRADPLIKEVLEKILNSRSRDSPQEDKKVLRLVPDVNFLLDYLRDVLELRRIYLSPQIREEDEERLKDDIRERLNADVKVGVELLGFSRETLVNFARIITEGTQDLRGVEKWKKKLVLNLKK